MPVPTAVEDLVGGPADGGGAERERGERLPYLHVPIGAGRGDSGTRDASRRCGVRAQAFWQVGEEDAAAALRQAVAPLCSNRCSSSVRFVGEEGLAVEPGAQHVWHGLGSSSGGAVVVEIAAESRVWARRDWLAGLLKADPSGPLASAAERRLAEGLVSWCDADRFGDVDEDWPAEDCTDCDDEGDTGDADGADCGCDCHVDAEFDDRDGDEAPAGKCVVEEPLTSPDVVASDCAPDVAAPGVDVAGVDVAGVATPGLAAPDVAASDVASPDVAAVPGYVPPPRLAALTAAVDALAAVDLGDLAGPVLLEELEGVLRQADRLAAQAARRVQAARVRDETVAETGYGPASWLANEASRSPAQARQLLARGRAWDAHPRLGAAVAAGGVPVHAAGRLGWHPLVLISQRFSRAACEPV